MNLEPAPLPFHDYGGAGPHVIGIHGHFGTSMSFGALARAARGRVRLIAPDQRGHGTAGPGTGPDVESYLTLLEAFLEHHASSPVTLFGHSMGGTHAMLLAGRRPDLVSALVVEDQPMRVPPAVLDVSRLPVRTTTFLGLAAVLRDIGIDDPWYFMLGAVRDHQGWGFAFDYQDVVASQHALVGDYSEAWRNLEVPILLLRGADSFLLTQEAAAEMVAVQPRARLVELAGCSHWVHDDDPAGVADALVEFVTGFPG
ncbi:alpha/beta fold hydrolase [Jiangella muralis]|uniref:alpha/beta fold hydrolase n=1 Tax=Jiangella muralis TaxID=702383 RepID=UPI00069F034E|nr:alpha/beta hydrolase [Jiangella muralis]